MLGHCGQGLLAWPVSGGFRKDLELGQAFAAVAQRSATQSVPVSPPPITITSLPRAEM
jgi:hypothetical protein